MSQWYRTAALSEADENPKLERWEYRQDATVSSFDVEVFVGKPLNVLGLKGADLNEVREYAAFLKATAARLYADGATEPLPQCPLCGGPLAGAATELRVFGVPYVRCSQCRHVMVGRQPAVAALHDVFATSEEHSSIYVDRGAVAVRMTEIIAPKIDWCLARYQRRYGQAPARVIDVGAGGGHFLAGARDRGFAVEGFEKSRASRQFAHEAFDLTLREDDFLTADLAPADLVTFWGLLEYVPEPRPFLRAARRALSSRGLLIVEVPRVDALGTLVQGQAGATVARHMDPTSHVNAFSDASLCTALVEEGLRPVAAWYFGMDAWETLVQASLLAGDDTLASRLNELIPVLQRAADRGRQCDDLVIAAIPIADAAAV